MSAQVVNRVVGAGALTLDDTRRVVGEVIGAAGFTRRASARSTTTFGREFRPRWVVVLSVVAAPPTLGLSLLALFVRARHLCTVTVESLPRGSTRVHLTGVLDAQIVRTLEDHLARHPVRPSPPPAPELLRDDGPTWAEVVGSAPSGDSSDGPTLLQRMRGEDAEAEPGLAVQEVPESEASAPEAPEAPQAPEFEDPRDAEAAVDSPRDDEDAPLPNRSGRWFSTPQDPQISQDPPTPQDHPTEQDRPTPQDPPTLGFPAIPADPAPAGAAAPSAPPVPPVPPVPALPALSQSAPSSLRPRLERPSAPTVEPRRESGAVSWDEALGRSPRTPEPPAARVAPPEPPALPVPGPELRWSPEPAAPPAVEPFAFESVTVEPAAAEPADVEPTAFQPPPAEVVRTAVAAPSETPAPAAEPVDHDPVDLDPIDADPIDDDSIDGGPVASPDAPATVLVFDNGEHVVVDGVGVMGRNPKDAGKKKTQVIKVNDPERSLSATHLAFALDGEDLVIVDRRSTNGTWIVGPDGKRERCTPGERTVVPAGTRVAIGARWFDVTRTE